MKIAILDDERVFCEKIKCLLERHFNHIDIYTDSKDLLPHISKYQVLFLDIEMPDSDGIELSQHITSTDIIFVTSHEERMIDAFSRNVIGFIIKDHLEIQLEKMIQRIKELYKDSFEYKDIVIPYRHILYFQYAVKDIMIELENERTAILKETTLKSILDILDERFIRINRNVIINIDHSMIKNQMISIHNHSFPVARRRYQAVKIAFLERKIHYVE